MSTRENKGKIKMQIEQISNEYSVRRLELGDVDDIFELSSKNILYYQYCPPFITKEGIAEDMNALPKGKTLKDKFYLGYYKNNVLVAILDLIAGYPNLKTAYIGLFMTDVRVQGKGIGTEIVEELCNYLKNEGFQRVELAWVKGNPQSEKFWTKNKFKAIEERKSNVADCVIAAERQLT